MGLRESGKRRTYVLELCGTGIPLGVEYDYLYQENRHILKSGQIIIIGTDGIWEISNRQGELFGKEKLRRLIQSHAEKTAENLKTIIIDAIQDFHGTSKPEDDISMVIIKVDAD